MERWRGNSAGIYIDVYVIIQWTDKTCCRFGALNMYILDDSQHYVPSVSVQSLKAARYTQKLGIWIA
jgi:hypothetical protein